MSTKDARRCVCVTGGSGFIGSWLVKLLLEKGYTVHATVKNLEDEAETKHLQAMDSEPSHLRLFQLNLLEPTSILEAIEGTDGIFHLASPNIFETQDPQSEILDPAIKGTLNVLRGAKNCGIKVVLVSSTSAISHNPKWPTDAPLTEDCWSDIDTLKEQELWYPLSKTLAEKAAWDFADKEGLELAVINPGMALGPILPPSIGLSVKIVLHLLQGIQMDLSKVVIGCVDVRDVARGMILLYETSAKGRYLCVESIASWADIVNKCASLCPEFPVQRIVKDEQTCLVRAERPSKKLIELGLDFTPIDKTINDTVASLKNKGLL
ncbi:hypothetical protein LUZ63_018060 [Rhynchospora breviuscula]|uniref:NAD-dependent epimerase/dehydratase domain-containing protein n=1 Tax=Rhynchospora breviuscula TaxID=2022672 RepID=A0A9Q0HI42_9POAL|nr:hypothetical protein LUZ63_018060 [Rhynchospora breviuscula]